MSRSATKSRAGTRAHGASVQVASPQSPLKEPPVEVEVVPGLTLTQWDDMLRVEETDDVVGEIMEELMERVMDGCLKSYVEKQAVAYSVSWARDFLVQAVQLEFLYRDEGDGPEEASILAEDSEPVPPRIDSWAPGCMAVTYINSPDKVASLENTEPTSRRRPCTEAQLISPTEQQGQDRGTSGPADNKKRVVTPMPPAKSSLKKIMKNTSQQQPRRPLFGPVIKQGQEADAAKRTVPSKSTTTDGFDSLHTSGGRQPVMSKRHPALRPPQLVSPQSEILDTQQLLNKRQTTRGLPVSSGQKYNKPSTTTIKVLKPSSNGTDQKAKLHKKD
ncbi:hypothetical protein NHX12_028849 [Muraenolepis orangiensis]|uniref:Uncharacterized protein n=1 Tax=Muraenolepis orangiensis TaxID=630683 RepID=A0A9Q0IN41_9TELE|nr:hypothetical protein NHX12_028849 [Muraenolepis orangiensis]